MFLFFNEKRNKKIESNIYKKKYIKYQFLVPELNYIQIYALSKIFKCPVYELHNNDCKAILDAIRSLNEGNIQQYFQFILSKRKRKQIFKIEKMDMKDKKANIFIPNTISVSENQFSTTKFEKNEMKLPELNKLKLITDSMDSICLKNQLSDNQFDQEIKCWESDFYGFLKRLFFTISKHQVEYLEV